VTTTIHSLRNGVHAQLATATNASVRPRRVKLDDGESGTEGVRDHELRFDILRLLPLCATTPTSERYR
jgi:hypothetical protein